MVSLNYLSGVFLKSNKSFIWALLFFICFTAKIFSFVQNEETLIRPIAISEGLNGNPIFDLYVNHKGLLFLGTGNGLLSYNGVFTKTYGFKDNLAVSVNGIQQDNLNRIWCKNFSDQVFYLENDTLKVYQPIETLLKSEDENLVDFIFVDSNMYLLTEKSLYFKTESGEFNQVFSFDKSKSFFFFSLYFDKQTNRLFLGSSKSIFEVDEGNIIKEHTIIKGYKDIAISNNQLYYIWKGNYDKLYINDSEIHLEVSNDQLSLYNFAHTSSGNWLCSSKGAFELDLDNQSIGEHVLPNIRVTDVVVDHENNHWISSLEDGLFFMPNRKMKRLLTNQFINESRKYTCIVSDDNGNVFVGTSNGKIIQFNSAKEKALIYSSTKDTEVEYIYTFQNKLITSVGVFEVGQKEPIIEGYFGKSAAQDIFGNLLIANYNLAGLLPNSFSGSPVLFDQLEVKPTIDYISTSIQLYIFRNKRARAVHYSIENESYYIGFSDGLYRFGIDGSVEEIKTKQDKPIIATDFHENDNGELWIASTQQGLLCLKKNEVYRHFNELNGLSNNKCRKIQADAQGVWVITDTSLDFYNFKLDQVINYGNNLGLNGLAINDFLVGENLIWFATNQGIIYMEKSVLNQKLNPYFEIKATQKDGVELAENSVLPYSKNSILINFNSTFYKSLGDYQFEYKLEPFHSTWQSQSAKENKLNFVALDPSDYVLRARLNAGSLTTCEIDFPFVVASPFWLQSWFIASLFLALIGLFFFVYKWAIIQTKKKQDIKEMLAISQLTALRSQMNPHFMFNVLNAIQGLIYSNQKSKANEYIGTFSTLMRKTLDVSAKKHITIAEEIETIKLYISLEKARFDDGEFEYEIILPDEDLTTYVIPSLIIQPFIENAIKHGLHHKEGVKKLLFVLKNEDTQYWKFIVEDNGVGREASNFINKKIKPTHNSFASNAIENRIELINKLTKQPITIEIEDLFTQQRQPMGTKVVLFIPIKKIEE